MARLNFDRGRRSRPLVSLRLAGSFLGLLLAAGAWAAPTGTPAAIQHPLDPLTFQEYWTVLEVLHAAGKVDSDTRFSMVRLEPPPKDLVWRFEGIGAGSGAGAAAAAPELAAIPRRAYAIVRQKEKEWEAVVDLASARWPPGRIWVGPIRTGWARSSRPRSTR